MTKKVFKANQYDEFNIISLHSHFGGENCELEISSGKSKKDLSFDLDKSKAEIQILKDIGFKILAITNHNVLFVDEYIKLESEFKDLLFLPGIECDVKMSDSSSDIIQVCIIFDNKTGVDDLNKIANMYDEYLISNEDNYIFVDQLFNVINNRKVIIYPHGTKKKGIAYTNKGQEFFNVELYDEVCNLEAIYPFFIDVNQEFHKFTLRSKIKEFAVSNYKKSISFSDYLTSIDRTVVKENFPFTYFWGDMSFDALYTAGLIGNTKRFVREKDIIRKSPIIKKCIIKSVEDQTVLNEIFFSHGINSIIGDSGSGKTLLLNYIYKTLTGKNIPNLTTSNANNEYDDIYRKYKCEIYDENDKIVNPNTVRPYIGRNIYRKFILAIDENNRVAPKEIFNNLSIKENDSIFKKLISDYEEKLNKELKRRKKYNDIIHNIANSVVTLNNSIKSMVANKSDSKYNFNSVSVSELSNEISSLVKNVKSRILDFVRFSKLSEMSAGILDKYDLGKDNTVLNDIKKELFKEIKKRNQEDIENIESKKTKLLLIESYNKGIRSVDRLNGEKVRLFNKSKEVNYKAIRDLSKSVLDIKISELEEINDLVIDTEEILSSITLEETIDNVEIVTKIRDALVSDEFIDDVFESVRGHGNVSARDVKGLKFIKNEDISILIDKHIESDKEEIKLSKDYRKYVLVDILIKEFEGRDVKLSEMSAGMLSKFYIRTLISNEISKMDSDPIIFFDEPDSNLSKKFIYNELVTKFKQMRMKYQIFFTTHEPLLIVNSDSNNLICCENKATLLDDSPEFRFVSGAFTKNKFFNNDDIQNLDDIIDKFADMIDGNKQAIKRRNKFYLGGSHYE